MKNLFMVLCALLIATGSIFADGHKAIKISSVKEDGSNVDRSITPLHYTLNSVVLDTTGSIPSLGGFYDYVTNGNNLHKVWVYGDTVIVAADQTDSLNAGTSTARKSYYDVSYDGGFTWAGVSLVSSDGNAYPNVDPVIISGARTTCIDGRQFVAGTRGGYVGVDVILGAGAFTNTLINSTASDNFAMQMSNTELACGYQNKTNDSVFFAKFNFTTNTYSGTTLLQSGTDASQRTFTAADKNGHVAVGVWISATSVLHVFTSSNSGSSFTAVDAIPNTTVNGDAISSWFGADMVYGPTGNLCVASSTLGPGNIGSPTGSKVVFYSPGINGGNVVVIADYHSTNVGMLSDTVYYNNHYSSATQQVGLTAVGHASLAYSSDGSRLFCVFSAVQKDTASYGYFYNDICCSYSDNNGATWSNPIKLTNTQSQDEIYPTISKTGCTPTNIMVTYSSSAYPGAYSFTNTGTPESRNYQILARYNPETGGRIPIGIVNISNEVPAKFSLMQNYPNPFNPSTKIRFAVPKSSNITIEVFDVTGKLVRTLVNNQFVTPGTKEVEFNAASIASGIYFYKLTGADFSQTKKMILVK